eukprot:Seg7299.1 transcript_id=Seg7299.1/GoldUCD/mRNA.D3Y31 product="NACHT LRR and PYD domains-containing protein 2" protein_id=Seg7299.1/GoldUCD/D3Y31
MMNDVLAKHLRIEFVNSWNSNFEHQWTDDQESGNKLLEEIKTKNVKFPFKIWVSQFQAGDSSTWDCSKLFFLLDERGLSLTKNISVYRSINGIKAIRNEVTGHAAKAECSDSEFENYAHKLKDAAKKIGGENACKEIEEVENQVLKTEDYKRVENQLKQQHAIESLSRNLCATNEKVEELTEKLQSMEISSPQDLKASIKQLYRTILEKWQRPYFEVQGNKLTTKFPRQQRCDEWVPISLAEVKTNQFESNEGLIEQSVSAPITLMQIIQKDEESKLNFLSGPPGIGKSSFIDYAVLSWAEDRFFNGENGCKFEVVLRFKCCDLVRYRGQKITKEELFEKTFGKREYASLLENVDTKDVLIILDGIDEFYAADKLFSGKAKDQMTYLVEDLIKPESTLSPGHYVLVSGRPYAIQMLEQKAREIGTGIHVQVQGFASDGIGEFISKFSEDDQKLNSYITDRLKESSPLRMCSEIPLFLHNICHILKVEKAQGEKFELETVTDIYTISLCLMIKFHCKIPSEDLSYMELHKLLENEKIKIFLHKITKIAWNLLKGKRVFLEQHEAKELKSEDDLVQRLIEGFIVKIPNELEENLQFIHLNMQEYLAAIYCVKLKIDGGYLLDNGFCEVLKFMSGLFGVKVKLRRDRRHSRKQREPQKKLKSLILGDTKIEDQRVEEHARLVFGAFKQNEWKYPSPAPLLDLFLSTMFEMFDQSAAMPSFINFGDKPFPMHIITNAHLKMFIHFFHSLPNAYKQQKLCQLDVSIKFLKLEDNSVLESLINSVLACNSITFRGCTIDVRLDSELEKRLHSEIQNKDFCLKEMKIIGCEMSEDCKRLAAMLTPSLRSVVFSLGALDKILMREVRNAIERSVKGHGRKPIFNLKKLTIFSAELKNSEGNVATSSDGTNLTSSEGIKEVAIIIPLVKDVCIRGVCLLSIDVEVISASILESRLQGATFWLKSLALADCQLANGDRITKLAPAIPHIQKINLRENDLLYEHYQILIGDIEEPRRIFSFIGDCVQEEMDNVKSLFDKKDITFDVVDEMDPNIADSHWARTMCYMDTAEAKGGFKFSSCMKASTGSRYLEGEVALRSPIRKMYDLLEMSPQMQAIKNAFPGLTVGITNMKFSYTSYRY